MGSLQATLDGGLHEFSVSHLQGDESPDRDASKCRKLEEWDA